MNEVAFYSIISVLIVSLVSFVGVLGLGVKVKRLNKILIYLISFSAGALFGDVFIHLLPEIVENSDISEVSFYILTGIVIFFILEKVIHWHHCHMPITEDHVHSFAYMNLVGDGLHNFIDGLIIVGGYLVSIPAGIATTIAVLLHEIPQEIGDFGILVHGGFTKWKALLLNFLSAVFAILGALFALWIGNYVNNVENILVSIAIGGFIYIAGSDLIPELHKESHSFMKSLLQAFVFVLGILVMYALLLFG